MTSDSRFIFGIAYNKLAHGKRNPLQGMSFSVINAMDKAKHGFSLNREERKQFYHDPAIVLNASEDDTNLKNLPIYINHNTSVDPVGKIHETVLNGSQIKIFGEIWDKGAIKLVDDGTLKSLSIGYKVFPDINGIPTVKKQVSEISLVEKPFFEGCDILVKASEDDQLVEENSNNKKTILYNKGSGIHMDPNKPPPHFYNMSAQPAEAPVNNAPPVLTAEQAEELIKGYRRMEQEVQAYKKKEEEEKLKTIERNKQQVDSTLAELLGVKSLYSEDGTEGFPFTKEEYQLLGVLYQGDGHGDALRKLVGHIKKRVGDVEKAATENFKKQAQQPSAQGNYGNVYSVSPALRKAQESQAPSQVPNTRAGDPYHMRTEKPLSLGNGFGMSVPAAAIEASSDDPRERFEKIASQFRASLFSGVPTMPVSATKIPQNLLN